MPPLVDSLPRVTRHRFMHGALFALLVVALCNGFAVWYVLNEHTVYNIDTLGYWVELITFKNNLAANPLSALYWFWIGLRMDDYPVFTVAPLLPFVLVESSRLWYILAIVNMFAIPSIGAFLLLSHMFVGLVYPRTPDNQSPVPWSMSTAIALIVILLSPTFWISSVAGLPSVGGLAIVFLVLFLTLKRLPNLRWRDEVTIGILFFLLGRFRRWYLIWIAAYFAARLLIFSFVSLRERRWRSSLRAAAQLLLCLGVFSGLLFTISGPFAVRALTTDYSLLYQPFQIPNFAWSRAFLFTHGQIGYIAALLGLAGLLMAIFHQRLRLVSAFLVIQYLLTFFLQARNQGFAYQHLYLLLPTLLLFSAFFLSSVAFRTRRYVTVIVLSVLSLFILFLSAFSPPVITAMSAFTPWTPTEILPPQVRSDFSELQRLHWTLFDLTRPMDSRIYVLASSALMNYEVLRHQHFSLPQQPDLSDRVFATHDLDLRDGFPTHLFEARFVVIAEPFQHYSLPEYSRVLVFPAERILQHRGMGKAYRRLPYSFNLDKNISVSIFERVRKFTQTEVDELSDALRSAYPHSPSVFRGPIAPSVLSPEPPVKE